MENALMGNSLGVLNQLAHSYKRVSPAQGTAWGVTPRGHGSYLVLAQSVAFSLNCAAGIPIP